MRHILFGQHCNFTNSAKFAPDFKTCFMRFFTVLVLCLCSRVLLAQEPAASELAPCGTAPGIAPMLLKYTARPQDFVPDRSSDTLYVGLQIHLLARDNGSGRFSPDRLLDAFCRLNQDFAASGIRFYFKNDWNLIDSTGWYQHETIEQGIDMMLTNNVSGALNAYFAANVADNCGYNLPYAGVAISHGCGGPNSHTWAHEVGHALSLPHPFIGWEGKVYNIANPTPDTLTYDYTHFHDSLETQIPAPLDTALVEYLDGSNCTIAADLVCDTKPDYLSYRWDCDGQGNSLVQQKDPTGATFYSDGTLFMSYSNDNCSNRFSDDQIAIMRATLQTEKTDWLGNGSPEGDITELPELLSPVGGQLTPFSGTVLQWSAVPNATRYVLQLSRFANFIVKELDVVTDGTSYTLGQLPNNLTYYWRVRAFNDWYACTELTDNASFKTADISTAPEPDAEGWRIDPGLLAAGDPIHLTFPESWRLQVARCAIYDVAGHLMWENTQQVTQTSNLIYPPSSAWPPGVYRMVFSSGRGVKAGSFCLYR